MAAKSAAAGDDDDGDKTKKAMKRPAAATMPSKSGPSAKKKKSKAHTKAKKTAKKIQKKGVPSAKMDALNYSRGPHGPQRYGSANIYTDNVNKVWRVNPKPGERVDKKFSMKRSEAASRTRWATLVAYVKSLRQT